MSLIKRMFQDFRRLLTGDHKQAMAAAARPPDPLDYALPALDGSGPIATDFPLGKTQPGALGDRAREPRAGGRLPTLTNAAL